jgi:hypothetical protein
MNNQSRLRLLSVFLVLIAIVGSGLAVDYRIDATLDTGKKTITGTSEITWSNSSDSDVSDLRFHLYFNAWRNKESSYLNSARSRDGDYSDWREGDWGGNELGTIEVRWLDSDGKVSSEANLTDSIEYIQPDDANPNDRTVMRIPLPQPVTPGAKLQITMGFVTKVPRPFARVGFRDDYFFLAHWFPKLGVLEQNGTWNCHQFIQTEFFSDYGDYKVSLTVPSGWVVGATGTRVQLTENDNGSATHVYHQDRVHEFAWTASPHFHEFQKKFEFPGLPEVNIRLLMMPDHLGQEDRYFAATEAALRYYGEWFGAYDYPQVTVIDPAWQSRSGGMEYPTLFTGGTRWLNPENSGSPEGVTVHECGHQFWYAIIGNNEFEDAWLDEGFNTYSTGRVMQTAFPDTFTIHRYFDGFIPVLFRDLPLGSRSVSGLAGYYSPLKLDIMDRPAWAYGPSASLESGDRLGPVPRQGAYVLNAYTKPALMLETLENYLGWKTFQKILSTYFERYRRKHPKPEDFFRIVNEATGQNLDWFWKQTYHSSDIFDYAVDSVDSVLDEQRVVIRRWGEAIFPMHIRVTFEGGDSVDQYWDGRDRWIRYRYQRTEKIASVVVDPDGILALDVNRTNNSWVRNAPTRRAASKWSLKWTYWLQNVLEFFAFFG